MLYFLDVLFVGQLAESSGLHYLCLRLPVPAMGEVIALSRILGYQRTLCVCLKIIPYLKLSVFTECCMARDNLFQIGRFR